MERFFSYSFEDGFETHATEASARASAQEMLELCRDAAAGDEWPDSVESICWGEIRGAVHEDKSQRAGDCTDFLLAVLPKEGLCRDTVLRKGHYNHFGTSWSECSFRHEDRIRELEERIRELEDTLNSLEKC